MWRLTNPNLRREATVHPHVSPFVQRVERQQRWFGFGANTARELFEGFAISNLRRPFRLNYSGQERKQNPWLFDGCNIPSASKVHLTVRRFYTRFVDMDVSLPNWITFLFDHPVPHNWSDDSAEWPDSSEQIARLIAETFEHSGELLARFSDTQLDQAFRFLLDAGSSEFMFPLVQPDVPAALRLRALRSFVPLFEQVMAVRCSPHLSHLDDPGARSLNGICYMWWDVLPIHGRPDVPERAEFDSEVLLVLQALLAIPHDACRESALHGLGHWSTYYPTVADIIDEFLSSHSSGLRHELVAYAKTAKTGVL